MFNFKNLEYTYMDEELLSKLDKIDSSITTFFGEVPFSSLTELMKTDMRTSKIKKKRRGNSKILVR